MYSYLVPRQAIAIDDRQHGERLGRLIGVARSADGRSAQQIAEAARLSVDTVRSLESGRVPTPSFVTVAKVAAALELSLDHLHAEASEPPTRRRRGPGGPA
jgi:transcriptional regulator with XRE-family HTH domain